MTYKTPYSSTPAASHARRPDLSRQLTSERIREHLATFEAGGGKVEVLGTTTVLKRIDPVPAGAPSAG